MKPAQRTHDGVTVTVETFVIGPALFGSENANEPTRSAPTGTPATPDTDTSHESHHA